MKLTSLCASAILLLSQAGSPAATVIYSDDFSGLAADTLRGTAPDAGGGTWLGTSNFKADGSVTAGAGSITLPFSPVSGNIYLLSANITFSTTDTSWIGVGFADASATWTGLPALGNGNRFTGTVITGHSWMISAPTAGQSGFRGPGGTNAATENPGVEVLSSTVLLTISLDTTAANWQTSCFVNNALPGTTTHTGAQPIDVVGFTSTTGAAGRISDFQLSVASTPDPDTDGDALPDAWELVHSTPPSATALNPGDDLENGGAGDGLTNLEEYRSGTDPNNPDSDGDLLPDGSEKAGAGLRPPTNPAQADTDGDGLNDKAESNTGSFLSAVDTGSNPTKTDTDGDGSKDGMEVTAGKNPNDPLSRLLRILAVGDSITAGYTDNPGWANHPFMFGYRGPLYTRLATAGYPFQFVGSSPEPWDGTSGDPTRGGTYMPSLDLRTLDQDHHRGYGGHAIAQVQAGIAGWIAADKPDVILLLIGINGIGPGSPAALNTLVDTIVAAVPDLHVIVAQITPRNIYNDDLWNYNVYIRDTLVPTHAGSPILFDTDADTLSDGVETNTGVFISLTNTGTNPTKKDTDGDGMEDAPEIADPFTDPTDANDYPPVPLVGLWRFEGDATDSSANANHGVLTNGATLGNDTPAELGGGQSLCLVGASQQHVLVPHSASLDMTARMTVAAWVKTAGTTWDGVLAKNPSDGSTTNHAGNYELRIANSTRKVNFGYQRGGANDTIQTAPAGTVADSTWTHLAITVDGTSAKFYRNGVLEETLAMAAGFGATNTSPLYIGTRADFFTGFDGCLDDVAIFGGLLGPAQINGIMNGDFSAFGVHEVPFEFTGILLNPAVPSVTLTFNSRPGKTYRVEYSTALAAAGQPGGWIELSDAHVSEGASTTYVDTVAAGSGPRVFYRVRENP